MDDTTWIASFKEELEYMLSEADSYYTFMNIKVNKQKSILMTNNTSYMTNNHTTLKFESEYVTLSNTPKNQSIRFLDVWFSLYGSRDLMAPLRRTFKLVVRSVDTLSRYPYGYTDIRIVVSGDGYPLTDMRISMDICADICDLHVM